jgi:hypothetical protein
MALGVAFIGLCQFGFTSTVPPGDCAGVVSPWARLGFWYQFGRQSPLSDLLDEHERRRLVLTSIATMALGGALAVSIRAHGPFRFRLRLRTLMIVIAALPVLWLAGQRVWTMWDRFDENWQYAEYFEQLERRAKEEPNILPSDPEFSRKRAEEYRQVKERYQLAMWFPWRAVDHSRAQLGQSGP